MTQSWLDRLSRPATFLPLATCLVVLLGVGLWPRDESATRPAAATEVAAESGLLSPISSSAPVNPELSALGARLFSDKRLSRDQTVSCESCHGLQNAGVDSLPNSFGINGQRGKINAPTVFNASLNFRQFWDGRAGTLEEQAAGPVENPLEMGFTWPEVVARLQADPAYVAEFKHLFPDGLTARNIRSAIADFERTLLTPDAPFDRHLRGEKNALNKKELAGYQLFLDYGCVACHQGQNVGGTMYEKLGVVVPYFDEKRRPRSEDMGRFNLTGDTEHQGEFKVPSLRNVARTAPYFHDGSVATLEQAVKLMGRHQLGIEFNDDEVGKLVAFLHSLTGKYQGKAL